MRSNIGGTAERFGVRSYGVVGWAYHGVRVKMELDKGFRNNVAKIQTRIYQQKI